MNILNEQLLQLYSIPIYTVLIGAEVLISNYRKTNYYSMKETLMNLYLNFMNAGIDMLLRVVIGLSVLTFAYQYHFNIHWHPILYWAVLLLAEDFLFWLEHYVDHSCRLFWAVHVTHHSSPEYNLSTGFRSSVLMPVYKYFYFIPLVIMGFTPVDVIFMFSLTQIYGILVHTQYIHKLPFVIEYIFVTPSHHRVHHASNIAYLDKNMGMVFIIWDRIFGTFAAEQTNDKPHYGLTKPIDTPHHPIKIISHEWHDIAKDWKKNVPFATKLKYIFMPPGWSHDGSTKTSKELQRDLESRQ